MTPWRARALLGAFADLPDTFAFQGYPARAIRHTEDRTGCLTSVVDLTISAEFLKDAYFTGIDILADLTDCVALLSYAPAWFELMSVTAPTSMLGVPFDIAVPVGTFHRTRSKIDGEKLKALGVQCADEGTAIALRSFRVGLSSRNPYRTLTELWTAAESLAEREARANGSFVERPCDKCGATTRLGPASHQYIRQYFERITPKDKTPDEYKKLADDTRAIRGTLVHGGKLHNAVLRQDVEVKISSLQSATAAAMVDRTGIPLATHRCQHLGVPYLVLRMQRVGPSAKDCAPAQSDRHSDSLLFEIPAVLSFLPDQFSECQEFTIDIGVFSPVPLHELAFPEPAVMTDAIDRR